MLHVHSKPLILEKRERFIKKTVTYFYFSGYRGKFEIEKLVLMSYTKVKLFTFFLAMTGLLASCSYEKSSVTGWDYNNPAYGGFQKFLTRSKKPDRV